MLFRVVCNSRSEIRIQVPSPVPLASRVSYLPLESSFGEPPFMKESFTAEKIFSFF